MAVLWLESFDYFGADMTNVGLRGYILFGGTGASVVQNNALARTGSGYYVLNSGSNNNYLIRAADVPLNVCVIGCGIKFLAIPSVTNNSRAGLKFRVGVNNDGVNCIINADGGINVYVGVTLVGSSAPNLITAGTFIWWEAKVIAGTGTASIEVRIGGATVLVVTGLTIAQVTGYGFGRRSDTGQPETHFDDLVINDTDFLGDRRVETLYPNADTALAQWTPTPLGTGFSCIDESVPSDADFITANVAGNISEFDKQNISFDTNSVAAVCPVVRAFKDSAGPATFTVGMNSAGNVINSPEFLPNTTIAYFSQIFELNPNGNIPWTKDAVNDAFVRVTRVV